MRNYIYIKCINKTKLLSEKLCVVGDKADSVLTHSAILKTSELRLNS